MDKRGRLLLSTKEAQESHNLGIDAFLCIFPFDIFPWMEGFIESLAYMRLKAEDQPHENVHSKIYQSDTTTFLLD